MRMEHNTGSNFHILGNGAFKRCSIRWLGKSRGRKKSLPHKWDGSELVVPVGPFGWSMPISSILSTSRPVDVLAHLFSLLQFYNINKESPLDFFHHKGQATITATWPYIALLVATGSPIDNRVCVYVCVWSYQQQRQGKCVYAYLRTLSSKVYYVRALRYPILYLIPCGMHVDERIFFFLPSTLDVVPPYHVCPKRVTITTDAAAAASIASTKLRTSSQFELHVEKISLILQQQHLAAKIPSLVQSFSKDERAYPQEQSYVRL